ncbi:hypothetical protein EMIT0111MI5_30162 [Burkholderia sp. IT-111MI5]
MMKTPWELSGFVSVPPQLHFSVSRAAGSPSMMTSVDPKEIRVWRQ